MGKFGNTDFDKYIADEIKKYSGVAVPVKTGFLERTLIKKVPCKILHPNPEDEFTHPDVGPSYRIISEYEKKFVNNYKTTGDYYFGQDPIIIEKIHPDGYMILNGHHRWAAAYRLGEKNIGVKIVNLTHEEDIKEILRNSNHDKRVTLDLDEVVFCDLSMEVESLIEKAPRFPFNRLYKERLTVGIPALFRFLEKNGYDIWVYSSKYYSTDYIKALFHKYHVNVTGVVTGTEKRNSKDVKKRFDSLIKDKYKTTLHIDKNMVVEIHNMTGEFKDYVVGGTSGWSKAVMDIVGEIEKDEKQ